MGEASKRDAGSEVETADSAVSLRKTLSANKDALSPELFAAALELLFPDFKCLRCGNDRFNVGPIFGPLQFTPEWKFDPGSRVEIICARCGMIETHAPNVLIDTILKSSAGQDGER